MAEVTVVASTDDGKLYNSDADGVDYFTARSTSVGTLETSGPLWVGQSYVSPGNLFGIRRSGLSFDTSNTNLPDNAVISAVIFRYYPTTKYQAQTWNLTVVRGRDISQPLVASDYGRMGAARTSFGSVAITDVTLNQLNDITLNASGRAAINIGGITKLVLRSDRDINGNEPALDDQERIVISSANNVQAAERPRLVITYTIPSMAVNTVAATSIGPTTATLNGKLIAVPGGTANCAFDFGITTDYGTTYLDPPAKEPNDTFSYAVTGLLPNTLYHFRAKATDVSSPFDEAFGADMTFVTLSQQPGGGVGVDGVTGIIGSIRHVWQEGLYTIEMGVGGHGRAINTIPTADPEDPIPDIPPDIAPEPEPPAEFDPAPIPTPPGREERKKKRLGPSPVPVPAPAPPREYGKEQGPALPRTADKEDRRRAKRKGVQNSPTINELQRGKKPFRSWGIPFGESRIRQLERSPQHLLYIHDIAFSATDHNSITWAAGTIILANGHTESIIAGSLELSATHYIYYVLGDNVLWSSTTLSDALTYQRTLVAIAVAVTSPALAKITVIFGTPGGGLDIANLMATDVEVAELSAATYDDVQDYINFFGDRTLLSGGAITDNGDGTAAVASLTGWCKETDSETAVGKFFDYGGANTPSLTDLTTNFVYVDYNGGTPQIVAATSVLTHGFKHDHIIVATIFRHGTTLHFHQSDYIGIGSVGRIHMHHKEEEAFHRVSGMVTSSVGTRNLGITAGVLYDGLSRHTTSPFTTPNSGTADATEANKLHDDDGGFATTDVGKTVHNTTDDTYAVVTAYVDSGELTLDADIFVSGENYDLDIFSYWYTPDSGSSWTEVTGATQISRTQYNDIASGLDNLTQNRYGVHWVYMDCDGHDLHVVYGQGNYKANEAEEAVVPSVLPDLVTNYCVLIAKIICQEGTDVLTILYPWTIVFRSSLATDHGSLAGLTDVADHAYAVLLAGTRPFTGEQSMGTNKLTNVVDPTADQDAATKKYVDDEVGGAGITHPQVLARVSLRG